LTREPFTRSSNSYSEPTSKTRSWQHCRGHAIPTSDFVLRGNIVPRDTRAQMIFCCHRYVAIFQKIF